MKVVINKCYGGFGLSEAAMQRYAELKGLTLYPEVDPKFPGSSFVTYWIVPPSERGPFVGDDEWAAASLEERQASNKRWGQQTLYDRYINRDDPALVQVVEELGDAANGGFARLRVVDVPDGVEWELDEYDGVESIHEVHRVFG